MAGRVRLHVRIDERTAGYLAIGLAVAGQAPVPIVMTSGTAVANLGPAVVEANYARVPLIVLSANRPYELLGTGANQTMEQLGYFDTQVRAAISLGLAEEGTEKMARPERHLAFGGVPGFGGGDGRAVRERRAGAVRHPAARTAGARSRTRSGRRPARTARTGGRGRTRRRSRSTSRWTSTCPRHRRHRRPRRRRAPEPGRAADRRRAHRAARRRTRCTRSRCRCCTPAGDHAGPADAAPAGVVAAGRPGGAGVRADHRPALAGRLGQLAGHRHPGGHRPAHRATAGCTAAPTSTGTRSRPYAASSMPTH